MPEGLPEGNFTKETLLGIGIWTLGIEGEQNSTNFTSLKGIKRKAYWEGGSRIWNSWNWKGVNYYQPFWGLFPTLEGNLEGLELSGVGREFSLLLGHLRQIRLEG